MLDLKTHYTWTHDLYFYSIERTETALIGQEVIICTDRWICTMYSFRYKHGLSCCGVNETMSHKFSAFLTKKSYFDLDHRFAPQGSIEKK